MLILVLSLLCTWTESFETQNYFPPNDWIIVNEDAFDAVWYRDTTEGHTGTHCATIYGDTTYAGYDYTNLDYLITPQVLPQGNDTILSFWYCVTSSSGCTLDILVSTNSPPQLPQFNLEQRLYVTETSWTQRSISLSAYSGTPIYIAFKIKKVPILDSFYLDDISLPTKTSQPNICNGRLRTKGPPSQRYMQLWGTHYEMGYATGYLLGEKLITYMIEWGIPDSISAWYWENVALPYFRLKYSVPPKYQDEAQGIVDGMVAKGVDLYHPYLDRDLTAEDVLCAQIGGVGKFVDIECSSVSGWGQSTINDDTLQGGYIIARNLEGNLGQCTHMGNMSLIIAYAPDSPGEHELALVTYDGCTGAASGVNCKGVGFCRNAGNHSDTNNIPPNSLIPVALSNRNGIEVVDPDNNSIHDIFDFVYLADHTTYLTSKDIHLFSPYDASHPTPGGILEINNVGDSLRLVSDNGISPNPIYSDWNLAATNHDRVLYPPVSCSRYMRLADSINADIHLTTQRAITLADAVAQYNFSVQSIVIRPDLIVDHPAWPCIGVSYARRNRGAVFQTRLWYTWNELFEGIPGVEEHELTRPLSNIIQISPNPFSKLTTISFGMAHSAERIELKIYDATGRVVKDFKHVINQQIFWNGTDDLNRKLPSGVYFLKFEAGEHSTTEKLLLIR